MEMQGLLDALYDCIVCMMAINRGESSEDEERIPIGALTEKQLNNFSYYLLTLNLETRDPRSWFLIISHL